MRTMLVNPLRATSTIHRGQLIRGHAKKSRKRRSNPGTILMAANPRRRRRRNALLMANPGMYSRNPLIMPNRRRRRNPFHPATSLRGFAMVAGTGLLAGGAAYVLDRLLFMKLGVQTNDQGEVITDADGNPKDTAGGVLLRNGVRLATGALAAYLWPGAFGAGMVGAFSYPIMGALEAWWRKSAATSDADSPTDTSDLEAELSDLEAELEDVLEAA